MLLLLRHNEFDVVNQVPDDVILAQHFALLAVQRFDALVLIIEEIGVMLDAGGVHAGATLIRQRADIVLLERRAMNGRCLGLRDRANPRRSWQRDLFNQHFSK